MKLKVNKWIKRLFLYPLSAFIFFILLALCFLPGPLFRVPYSSVLLSTEGRLLAAKIAKDEQWRFPAVQRVPEKYEKALLAFEDKRFYSHFGVDPIALIRASFQNLRSGKVISGGSTITMQVIRLSRNRERTLFEKMKEVFLSMALEIKFSKKEILRFYASHAPFGGNVVGIEAAAWRYFGRGANRLSWAESALLAILPNSPSLIHPGRNRSLLKQKRDRLLRKLRDSKTISDLQYKLACSEPLPNKPYALPSLAPHLLQTLMKNKANPPLLNSTIRYNLQKKVNQIVASHYQRNARRGIHNSAVMVIDNKSSKVIAYVGNSPQKWGSGSSNHSNGLDVDIIQRPRSTGSILKPLLYMAMLKDSAILPTVLVPDVPTRYRGYIPSNFDRKYRGAVPAKQALARSLNIPAVRMLYQYGLYRFYDFLKKLGMTTLHRSADDYGLTLILGGAEGSLWDIAKIYSHMAQITINNKAHTIQLLRSDQKTPVDMQGLTAGPAYLTIDALLEVVRPGTDGYWKNFNSSQKIAWKTGTSFGFRDAWAIGATPKYTVGVWVGNADGEGKPELTGLRMAAPVLFDVFNTLERSKWFALPEFDLKKVNVCRDSGYIATPLCESKSIWVNLENHFSEISPYNIRVHLDQSKKWRVHSFCSSPNKMKHVRWFVLPPVQEYYYKKNVTAYKTLPPYRQDCLVSLPEKQYREMNIVYPTFNTTVYIPVGLDGKVGDTIFRAFHRKPETTIFWHLDGSYLGKTKKFHEQILRPEPGEHKLTLVDEKGNRVERVFKVIGN